MENNTLVQKEYKGCSTGHSSPVVNPIKIVYIIFGMLFLSIGAAGTVLPLVPTTPLVLLAAVCFAKSSNRLHSWFLSTRLYRKTIDGFVRDRVMTVKAKLALLTSVTVFMCISFATMVVFHTPVFLKILLAMIWLSHVIYFALIVKTVKN